MTGQPDLFAASGRRGWRSDVVARVRRDFADLLDDPQHAGMQASAVLAAHNAWALSNEGDRRGATDALAELRRWYDQADAVRRARAVDSGATPLAAVLSMAAPQP